MALREASNRDKSMLTDEVAELRGIVESMWSKLRMSQDGSPGIYLFKFGQRSPSQTGSPDRSILNKECAGDEEDTNSLSEIVEEVSGDDVQQAEEIEDERRKREPEKAASKHAALQRDR